VGGPYGKAKLVYLDPDADIEEGDAIVSFSSDENFPKGLLLGYVLKVVDGDGSLNKSAVIKIAVDCSQLEEVLCIK